MSLSSEFSGLPPQSTAVSQTQQGLAQKHSKRLSKQMRKTGFWLSMGATRECELVINPVRKETGRCHEPETQKEG